MVLLSFLLLVTLFRSVIVALKAAVTNLLSVGAAYGAVVPSSNGAGCRTYSANCPRRPPGGRPGPSLPGTPVFPQVPARLSDLTDGHYDLTLDNNASLDSTPWSYFQRTYIRRARQTHDLVPCPRGDAGDPGGPSPAQLDGAHFPHRRVHQA